MMINPLQALNSTLVGDQVLRLLEIVKDAEATCAPLYEQLTSRTQKIAEETLQVQFDWRVRVGGTRGFQELLLPVFHPVYGVPYIPSSSLKGVARAWAKNNQVNPEEINFLLGELDSGVGTIQILDAFPTQPCLSVDIANPQWTWNSDNQVKYQPTPHFFLSLLYPEILIGLCKTRRGKANDTDLATVKTWLNQALMTGIGSRVSAGYGRSSLKAGLPYHSCHHFRFYSQGLFQEDFRPVALRGVLRYWLRAIALGLYDINTVKSLENRLFGQLSQEGSIRLSVAITEEKDGDSRHPYYCQGVILLEAKTQQHLQLIEAVLQLASHLGGFGKASRRPLHWNNKRLRGCFWELSDSILPYEDSEWHLFLEEVLDTFRQIHPEANPPQHSPGNSHNRYQDVLNNHAKIFLIPANNLKYPEEVNNWSSQGYQYPVIGPGLQKLYSSDQFKGVNPQGRGNANVGGKLGIPSFVWIKSNYPDDSSSYQVVTIFGVDQVNMDREKFAEAIPPDSLEVWYSNRH